MVSWTGSFWLALALAPLGAGALGFAMERLLIRRIYEAPHLYQFLLTFGLLLVLDDLVRMIWGFTSKNIGMPAAFQRPPVFVFGSPLPIYYAFIIAVGLVIVVGMWFTLGRTKLGKMMDAASSDPEMVEALGIDVRLVYSMVFMIGAALAGLGGALAAPLRSASPGMGSAIIIESFIVMVVGGVGSVWGALIASSLLGVLRSFGTIGFPDFEVGFAFFLVIGVLLVRPWGLLGKEVD